jgi:hypothetical protein
LARSTIERGLKDLDAPPLARGRVRREGGGPRRKDERDAMLLDDLKRLVEPATLGDPTRPLLWVSKSLDKLASALADMGHSISPNSVRKLLTNNQGDPPALPGRQQKFDNSGNRAPGSRRRNFELEPRSTRRNSIDDL